MSFEIVVMISAITEVVVISAICLTLINAFSHGAVARSIFGSQEQATVKESATRHEHNRQEYQRAA